MSDSLVALTVDVGLFDGPAKPDGEMAVSDSPVVRANVTVVDNAGRKATALTTEDGLATLHLTPGRYSVLSTACGPLAGQTITLTATVPARLQIACPVP